MGQTFRRFVKVSLLIIQAFSLSNDHNDLVWLKNERSVSPPLLSSNCSSSFVATSHLRMANISLQNILWIFRVLAAAYNKLRHRTRTVIQPVSICWSFLIQADGLYIRKRQAVAFICPVCHAYFRFYIDFIFVWRTSSRINQQWGPKWTIFHETSHDRARTHPHQRAMGTLK